ncbi:MAG: SIMPL domain-containing protein, partial [Gemmataceae bacterium]|nr:SIMPL domain-containing protein [Gemmataceae bacterium]
PNIPVNNAALFNGFPQHPSLARVEFFSGDDREARSAAFTKAMQAAVSSAKGIAAGAGVKLGDLVAVSEQTEVNYVPALGVGVVPLAEGPHQDVNGEVELTVRVRVTFRF